MGAQPPTYICRCLQPAAWLVKVNTTSDLMASCDGHVVEDLHGLLDGGMEATVRRVNRPPCVDHEAGP